MQALRHRHAEELASWLLLGYLIVIVISLVLASILRYTSIRETYEAIESRKTLEFATSDEHQASELVVPETKVTDNSNPNSVAVAKKYSGDLSANAQPTELLLPQQRVDVQPSPLTIMSNEDALRFDLAEISDTVTSAPHDQVEHIEVIKPLMLEERTLGTITITIDGLSQLHAMQGELRLILENSNISRSL